MHLSLHDPEASQDDNRNKYEFISKQDLRNQDRRNEFILCFTTDKHIHRDENVKSTVYCVMRH